MKAFLFQYRSTGKELMVTLKAENFNKAMIDFATKYHEIQEVYEIAETLLNSDKEMKKKPEGDIMEWLVKMKNEADEHEYNLNKEGKTNFGCFYLGKAAAFRNVLLMLNKDQNAKGSDTTEV